MGQFLDNLELYEALPADEKARRHRRFVEQTSGPLDAEQEAFKRALKLGIEKMSKVEARHARLKQARAINEARVNEERLAKMTDSERETDRKLSLRKRADAGDPMAKQIVEVTDEIEHLHKAMDDARDDMRKIEERDQLRKVEEIAGSEALAKGLASGRLRLPSKGDDYPEPEGADNPSMIQRVLDAVKNSASRLHRDDQ